MNVLKPHLQTTIWTLLKAHTTERGALLKEWVEPDLLFLDDLFLARRISEHAAKVLQAIVHQRYKARRSIVVTSNRVVQDWG